MVCPAHPLRQGSFCSLARAVTQRSTTSDGAAVPAPILSVVRLTAVIVHVPVRPVTTVGVECVSSVHATAEKSCGLTLSSMPHSAQRARACQTRLEYVE